MVLRLRREAVDWSAGGNAEKAAKCIKFSYANTGEDPWFDPALYEDALAVCNGDYDGKTCPLRQECLEFACINNESDGVWGGLPEHDRRALRKKNKPRVKRGLAVKWEWHPPTDPEPPDEPEKPAE